MNTEAINASIAALQRQAGERYERHAAEWHERRGGIVGLAREKADSAERLAVRRRLLPRNDGLALERILGKNNLFHVNYFEQALCATRAVARVHIVDEFGVPAGFGTGFLVGPGLFLTNNHVLESEAWARRSFIEFDFEYDLAYRPKSTTVFALDPDALFVSQKYLDFTFVAVAERNDDSRPLSDFGSLPLIEDSGKAIIGEPVTIIQHPNGGFKRLALRDSVVLGIPEPDNDFLHYSTDTNPGASGAPVTNDQWQVVALHHSSVPGSNGGWVANEGVRVSRIIRALGELAAGSAGHTEEAHTVLNVIRATSNVADSRADHLSGSSHDTSLTTDSQTEAAPFPARRWDADDGYDARFLGSDHNVPLPMPRDGADDIATTDSGERELRYTHFSVVMSKQRRLPYVTAVNVHGRKLVRLRRGDDRWRLDPRLPTRWQIDNDCYKRNDLDRGHLVRRLSPVWGSDREAKKAEVDTFHYTNCAPQHKNLNRKKWLDLEDYILELAAERNLKVCVFTGPVFRPDDMLYRRQYRIPADYWKVVATVERGRLRSAEYLQTQKNLLPDVQEAYGDYKTYRVPVAIIAQLSELDFGDLVSADPRSRFESNGAVREVDHKEQLEFI